MSNTSVSTRRTTGRRLSTVSVFGELLVTAGVLLLLFAFYEAFWTNLQSGLLQAEANEELGHAWEDGQRTNPRSAHPPELGEAFARIYVPSYGSDWHFAVLEGTTDDVLLRGPGRYTETQMPSEPGNFSVAGHRVGKGAPFNDLGSLEVCDAIVVETATEWITYRVLPMGVSGDVRHAEASQCLNEKQAQAVSAGQYAGVEGRHITLPGDVSVLAPVPGGDNGEPNPEMEKIITLTTCHPQFSNAERMIIHAMQVDAQPKVAGERPDVLEEK